MNFKKLKLTLRTAIISLSDGFAAILLLLFSFVMYPTTHLRGIEKAISFARFLLPRGLALPAMRAYLDLQFSNYTKSIAAFESLINKLHKERLKLKKDQKASKLILTELYSGLAQSYLKAGHIDYAAMIVIRAYNKLGVQTLLGLGEMDIKTAHIIRAGLSAGRLLDEGGVATLVVKPSSAETKKRPMKKNSSKKTTDEQKDSLEEGEVTPENKVLKFPVSHLSTNLGPDNPTKH